MYLLIKSLLRKIISPRVLYRVEPVFRNAYSMFFRGPNFKCTLCGFNARKFIQNEHDFLCPACGSIARTRRLYSVIEKEITKDNLTVLDFSPSRPIYRKLKAIKSLNYFSTDLSGDFISDFTYDITQLDIPDNTFDLIICYHILEHVPDDEKAMSELYRVLKHGGKAIIQTPFTEGLTHEDKNEQLSVTERISLYGQADHVRIYSISDLKIRLERAGFTIQLKEFKETPLNIHLYKTQETILICFKH